MAQYPNLGSLQARVLCYVAEENPRTMNEVATKQVGRNMSKNVRDIFIKLKKDGYLKHHKDKSWYPTEMGVNLALLNGADPAKVRKKAALFFGDIELEKILFACDVVEHPALGVDILKVFNLNANTVAKTGKLSLPLLNLPLNSNFIDDFIPLMKKYPRIYKRTFGILSKALDYFVET